MQRPPPSQVFALQFVKVQCVNVKYSGLSISTSIPPPFVPAVQEVNVRSLSVSDSEVMIKYNAPPPSPLRQDEKVRLDRVGE